jgi:2-C-methyl-D-erythritol 4-phosphate cytidylyltransferase
VIAVALVVAAGRGERLGFSEPKALVPVGGVPMLEWSVRALQSVSTIAEIVVALPPGVPPPAGCRGVVGGSTRTASVQAAFAAASADGDPVLIHDAARPLVTVELIEAVLAGIDGVDAAIAAAPTSDTIKECDDSGLVLRTLDRSRLWAVQTPQVFTRSALERALEAPEEVRAAATDEASLVERRGGSVRVVAAPAENFKVTTRRDLVLAEQLLGQRGD